MNETTASVTMCGLVPVDCYYATLRRTSCFSAMGMGMRRTGEGARLRFPGDRERARKMADERSIAAVRHGWK